jgi:1-acyl-sn-glycerol-3-phosphate acyltransferase
VKTPWIYPASNFLQRRTLALFADFKVTGVENVPPMGPLIVVANHQSYVDPPLLGASIPRRLWFLAKKEIFQGPIADWFLKSYGAFPLDREDRDIRAYRWVLNKLQRDGVVAIFPEGTRSPRAMKHATSGVVQLALKTQAPLLPVGITGTEHLGHWLRTLHPTGRIRVNIGTVFSLPSVEGKPNKEVIESLVDTVMHRVAALLPASYRGVYEIGHDAVTTDAQAQSQGIEKGGSPLA